MRARSEGPHAEQGDRAEASHERGRHSVRTRRIRSKEAVTVRARSEGPNTVNGGRCNEPLHVCLKETTHVPG